MSDNGEPDLSDFADMWAEASEAEAGGSEDGTTDIIPEVLTGLEDETDTDNVEGEITPDAGGPDTDKPESAASDDWDWSANADRLVPVKVRGEELTVPLKELRDGYMRQQDYTRGTQEIANARRLAQWAQDVQNGFEVDPEGMLESFARAFKIDLGAPKPDPLAEVDEDLRPVYQQMQQIQQENAELRAAWEQAEQQRTIEMVRHQLEGLKTEFGEAFDPKETILVAQQYNLPLREAHYLRSARLGTPVVPPSPPTAPAVGAEVVDAAAQAAEATRLAGKAAAQGTVPKSRFKASEIATTEFNDIGELFELVASGSQT